MAKRAKFTVEVLDEDDNKITRELVMRPASKLPLFIAFESAVNELRATQLALEWAMSKDDYDWLVQLPGENANIVSEAWGNASEVSVGESASSSE